MKHVMLWWSLVLLMCGAGPCAWAAESTPAGHSEAAERTRGVRSLEERIQELESKLERPVQGDRWYDRINISGLIEVEAYHTNVDFGDPAEADEESSDVDLATVELAVDARIVDHVDGHVLVKYEEDDLFVDEGFVTLNGTERFPVYLIAGRQYIPFGNYDSRFVTDPNTLLLGETTEGAVVIGYRPLGDTINLSVGAFNGRVDEAGHSDQINNYVASVVVTPFEGLLLGASYTSNLASSNELSEAVNSTDKEIDSLVGGWSAFVTFEWLGRITLIGEYVAALDHFAAGEIYEGDTQQRRPSAWNTELAVALVDGLELAVRYGGSYDGGAEFLPETQYGGVINWAFFENTNLALEYLHGEFEDDYQDTDTVTAQLSVSF